MTLSELSELRCAVEAARAARASAVAADAEVRRRLLEAREAGVSVIELAGVVGLTRIRVYQLLKEQASAPVT